MRAGGVGKGYSHVTGSTGEFGALDGGMNFKGEGKH